MSQSTAPFGKKNLSAPPMPDGLPQVELSDNSYQVLKRRYIRKGKNGPEVLPSFWSDNYFSMLPGKSKEISVEYRESDTGSDPCYFKLNGWNINPVWLKIQ